MLNFIKCFEQLLHQIGAFENHLHSLSDHYPCQLLKLPPQHKQHPRKYLVQILKQMNVTSTGLGQSVLTCPGAVACTPKGLAEIGNINDLKQQLKHLIATYRNSKQAKPTQPIHDALSKAGYHGILLTHVTRQIPTLNQTPKRIAWSEGKVAKIKKISQQDAKKELMQLGDQVNIQIQLQKLTELTPSHQLIKKYDYHTASLVNITTFQEEESVSRINKHTALPIFYLLESNKPYPTVCFSQKRERKKTRSDRYLEGQLFLPSIHVYLKKGKYRKNGQPCPSLSG